MRSKQINRLGVFCSFIIMVLALASFADDIDTLKARLVASYKAGNTTWGLMNADSAVAYLSSLQADGCWPDINYFDHGSAPWTPLTHVQRLLQMALAFNRTDYPSYHDTAMSRGIVAGLDYWYNNDAAISSDNWWYNDIGQQLALGPLLLMMEPYLDTARVRRGAEFLFNSGAYAEGQNLVWESQNDIWRGCLRKSESDINLGLNAIKNELTNYDGDGLTSEFTFFQHGLFYNGGYGRGFMADITFWAVMTRNLLFAFDEAQTDRLTGLTLDADRWMVRRNTWDFAATGREISRGGPSWNSFGVGTGLLLKLPTSRSEEMRSFVASLDGIDDSAITGDKYFSTAEFHVHKRKNYHASIKMCSNRIFGTEAINSENIKGYYLSFGVFELMPNGNEYGGIGAVWDWTRLPGVTCPRCISVPSIPDISESKTTGTTDFAGCASDGRYGVSGFDLNWGGVSGRKAWFCFDDEIVALGAGINRTGADTVATSINQCRLFGDVWAGYDNGNGNVVSQGLHARINPKWVFHDSVGYVFSGQAPVTLKNQAQSGSWYSINKQSSTSIVSEDVFSLWQDHGVGAADKAAIQLVEVQPCQLPMSDT